MYYIVSNPQNGYCNELMQINQWSGINSSDLCHWRPPNATGWMSLNVSIPETLPLDPFMLNIAKRQLAGGIPLLGLYYFPLLVK